jgi:hypothetical protein
MNSENKQLPDEYLKTKKNNCSFVIPKLKISATHLTECVLNLKFFFSNRNPGPFGFCNRPGYPKTLQVVEKKITLAVQTQIQARCSTELKKGTTTTTAHM